MIYEIIDEQGRINRYVYTTEKPEALVVQSHGYSYLGARNQMKELDLEMGLEKGIEDKIKENMKDFTR